MSSDERYVFKSARFNRDREQDAAALEIIEYWEKQDYSFKELVTDRLIRGENVNPATFQKGDFPYQKPVTADEVRTMLAELQQSAGATADEIAGMIAQIPQPQSTGITLEEVRLLLESFADEIVRHLKRGGAGGRSQALIDDDDDGETVSAFAKNFARGFIQRQRKGMGEDDE